MTKSRGFTLMELLIAVSIFAVIALCLYSAFSGGIKVWQRQEEGFKYGHSVRLGLARMAKELKNCVNYSQPEDTLGGAAKDRGLFFNGAGKEMSFITVIGADMAKVSYAFEQDPGHNGALKRRVVPQKEGFKEDSREEETMLSGLDNVFFEYAYQGGPGEPGWKGLWTNDGKIPKGVRITVEFSPDGKRKNKEVFRNTVFIPTGVLDSE